MAVSDNNGGEDQGRSWRSRGERGEGGPARDENAPRREQRWEPVWRARTRPDGAPGDTPREPARRDPAAGPERRDPPFRERRTTRDVDPRSDERAPRGGDSRGFDAGPRRDSGGARDFPRRDTGDRPRPPARDAGDRGGYQRRDPSEGRGAPPRRDDRDAGARGGFTPRDSRDSGFGSRDSGYGSRDSGYSRDGGSRGGYGGREPGGRDGGADRDGGSRGGYGGRDSRDGGARPGYGSRDGGGREGAPRDGGYGREGGSRGGFGSRDSGFGREGGSRDSREGGARPGYGGREGGGREGGAPRDSGFGREGGSRGGFGARDGGSRGGYGARDGGDRESAPRREFGGRADGPRRDAGDRGGREGGDRAGGYERREAPAERGGYERRDRREGGDRPRFEPRSDSRREGGDDRGYGRSGGGRPEGRRDYGSRRRDDGDDGRSGRAPMHMSSRPGAVRGRGFGARDGRNLPKKKKKVRVYFHQALTRILLPKLLVKAKYLSPALARQYIEAGRVRVNARVVSSRFYEVNLRKERVTIDEAPTEYPRRLSYMVYNKPIGLLCEKDDPAFAAIFDQSTPWSFPFGRLTRSVSGLVILSNDPRMIGRQHVVDMELQKEYRIRINKHLDEQQLEELRRGILVDDEYLVPLRVNPGAKNLHSMWLDITLLDDSYHKIFAALKKLGVEVVRMRRMRIGLLNETMIPTNEWRELSGFEMTGLGLQRFMPGELPPEPTMPLRPRLEKATKGKPGARDTRDFRDFRDSGDARGGRRPSGGTGGSWGDRRYGGGRKPGFGRRAEEEDPEERQRREELADSIGNR